jgi:oligoendopeptidase F
MSYNDDIYSMSTLAHELGHSMHSYYARKTQPYVYSAYGLFQAEVASNMHQALTRRHLLATNKDPEFQIAVIEEAMANFYRYFFIMPSLARFELEIHERVEGGGALTADYLNGLMADLIEVYGSEVELTGRDRDRTSSTWAQFHTHLYSNFYVYQYATGIAGANHLAGRVAAGDPKGRGGLPGLLEGAAMYPLDGLKLAGVDAYHARAVASAFVSWPTWSPGSRAGRRQRLRVCKRSEPPINSASGTRLLRSGLARLVAILYADPQIYTRP